MTEPVGADPAADPAADRPVLPAGYGTTAVEGGQLPWSWAAERLAGSRNYWLCTTTPDGRPHAMPVWGVWLDASVIFSTDPASRKGRNLARSAAAVVHLESGDDVVVLEGRVEVVRDKSLLRRIGDDYEAKYAFRIAPDNPAYGVYALRPAVAFGWRETDFPTSATRWRFARN